MSQLARVSGEGCPEVPVAAVGGEIDASNAAEVAGRLRELLTNRSTALIVDLSETSYLDSAGIDLLFALGDDMATRRQQLHLVVPPAAPIARSLAISGLDAAVPVHASRIESLARLGRR